MVAGRPAPSPTPFPTSERPRPRREAGSAARTSGGRDLTLFSGPAWSLRIEGKSLAVVLERAALPGGAELVELVFRLPHVPLPFDFRDGIERFRHQRGVAEELSLRIDARIALDWLFRVTGGQVAGSAFDDALVLVGRTQEGTRYTVRARLVPDGVDATTGEPLLQLSLYQIRVYGPVDVPWPVLAGRILDALPPELVADRTLTTVRLRMVRRALAWGLASLGWKMPDVNHLEARGVELREGRFVAQFFARGGGAGEVITLGQGAGDGLDGVRSAFERFIEDLELKRHHGQIDRLIANQQIRDALGEVYRAFDGPPRPGFLAERIIGICASQPILFDEGERVCLELLEKDPEYAQALCGLGAIAMARGRLEEAAVHFERLAASLGGPGDREDATAADLAVADALRGFAPDEARSALERVLDRAPDHEEALSELIAIAEASGDTRAAMPLYKRLLFSARSKERTRDAGLRLARFALERGEPEDARVLLRVVLEAAPNDLDAQMALADVEAEDGEGGEAVRILEGALRGIPPQDTPRVMRVIVRLARVYLDLLGDPARARRVLWRAGDHARLGDGALRELAELAIRARDGALALRFIELLPAASPQWCDGQALRAEALLMRGDGAGALGAVLAVLAKEPDHEHALQLLERTAPDPDRRQWLVTELFESAQRATPGEARARVLHRVAAMYVSLELPFDAIDPLRAALEEAPESTRFEERAALLMDLQGKFGLWHDFLRVGALRLPGLRDASRTSDAARQQRVALLVSLGRAALAELDDDRSARGWLEEAMRLAPRHLEAHELLAASLERQRDGESVRALAQVWMRLENIRPDPATQDAARIALAELQLTELKSGPLARATLQRVSAARRRDPQVLALDARIAAALDARRSGVTSPGMTTRAAPTAPLEPEPPARTPPPRFDEAVAAADAGDDPRALALLRAILVATPDDGPARDLLALLVNPAPTGTTSPTPRPAEPQVIAAAPTARADAVVPTLEAASPAIEARVAEMDAIETHLQAATTAFLGGRLDEAAAGVEAVLAIDADVVPALELLNAIAEARGDHETRAFALQHLIRSVFDVGALTLHRRALGETLEALGDQDAALEAYAQYLRLAPFDRTMLERLKDELPAHTLAEIHEAAVDVAEDEGREAAREKALVEAAGAHLLAGDARAALHAAERIRPASAAGDPELLLAIARTASAAGADAVAADAAARVIPDLLPGAELDAMRAIAELDEGAGA